MEINKFGGEFKLIDALVKPVKQKNVIKDYGDDAAVIDTGKPDLYQLISTDMFIDGDHFSTKYFTPLQIGYKISEATISDIAAMGGKPLYAFICISLRRSVQMSFVRSLYRGLYSSCLHHKVAILGGDTVRNNKICTSMTIIGEVSKKNLCLRSGAKDGDLIKVTGELGGANAGFIVLKRNYVGYNQIKKKHLQPRCRMDIVEEIAPYASAMIDISDGVGGDLGHICRQSGVGAEVIKQDIPIPKQAIQAGRALKVDPYDFAINGGEDFELLYTVHPRQDAQTPGTVIGKITKNTDMILIDKKYQTRKPLSGGYQHF